MARRRPRRYIPHPVDENGAGREGGHPIISQPADAAGSDLRAFGRPAIEFFQPLIDGDTLAPGLPALTPAAAPSGIDPTVWAALLAWGKQLVIKSQEFYQPNVRPIPRVSTQFQAFGQTTTIAPGTILIPGCSQVIPKSNECVVSFISIFIGSAIGLTFNTAQLFTLLYNNSPNPSATNLTTFGRPATSVQEPFPVNIEFPAEGTLAMNVNNVDGASYIVGAYFTGWYHPSAAAQRWRKGLVVR